MPGAQWYEDVLASSERGGADRGDAEEDIYMLYTGGTTGMPKGVMYDMGGMVALVPRARAAGLRTRAPPEDLTTLAPSLAEARAEPARSTSAFPPAR